MSGELKSVLEDGPIEGEPLVSVCVITYNHGKYIRQCLDGILMQKVNFPYEVLIHDDASPDDTADIIREYWAKYPTVIKPILQTENRYSQGLPISKLNYDRAKGKYIAQCEGDDYWTDDGKLQMQVDFLEEHGEYIACVHRVKVIDGEGHDISDKYPFPPGYNTKDFTIDSVDDIPGNKCSGHLSSLVYRNLYFSLPQNILENYYSCKCNGDTKLSLLLVLNGPIKRFCEMMSTYRYDTNPTSTSWSSRNKGKITIEIQLSWLDECDKFSQNNYGRNLYFPKNHLHLFYSSVLRLLRNHELLDWRIMRRCLIKCIHAKCKISDICAVSYYWYLLIVTRMRE